jgi:NPCBM/NEW2 domain
MKALRALSFLLLVVSITRAAELATLSGKKIAGDVVAVDAKGVRLKVGEGDQTIPLTDVVMVDLGHAMKDLGPAPYILVELTDGTQLLCSDFKIRNKIASLTLLGDGKGKGVTVAAPNTGLFYIIRDAQDAKNRLDFQSILTKRGKRDQLIFRRGDQLDAMEGTFGEGDEEGSKIDFEASTGQKRPAFQNATHGMIFSQLPTGERPPTVCKVHDVYKNVLYAKAVTVKDKGVAVTTVSDVTIDYPSLRDISKLDFSSGVLRYLSDIDPAKVDQTSDTGLVERYGRDRNLDNEPIRVEGIVHPKGLTVHTTATLVFDIEGEYKEFRTTLGMDETASPDSAVQIQIEGDNRELFKGVVRRKDKPRPLTLDVRNVKQLRIAVKPDGVLDLGNQITFVDAKVTK